MEASHKLLRGEAHGFVASAPVFAVILPAELDAPTVEGEEA